MLQWFCQQQRYDRQVVAGMLRGIKNTPYLWGAMWLQDGRVRRYRFSRKRKLLEQKKNEKTKKRKQHYADKPEAAHMAPLSLREQV